MPTRQCRARTPWRRFTLGSGPLKRTSDRVEFLSRVVLVLALLAAAPAGALAGTAVTAGTRAVAAAEAAARHPVSATLLADAPNGAAELTPVPTPALWTGPDGSGRAGRIPALPSARAGSSVEIWVDRAGRPADPPLSDAEAVAQGVVIGVLTLVGVVLAVLLAHLGVVRELEHRRARRWERGWATVEPLWVSRFR